MTMISHVIALATVLCTCCPRDTTDFSLHKQENRKKKKIQKSPRKKYKKNYKKKETDFKMYKYPAITITIIETPATWY